MGRPRKNPAENFPQKVQERPDEWKLYFAAAMTGLIARGGFQSEQIMKTATQYADDALRATNGGYDNVQSGIVQ